MPSSRTPHEPFTSRSHPLRWRAAAASLVIGLTVATMPTPARAFDAQPEESTLQAQQLYREGQNYYETANYTGAIDKWTQAYGLMDWGPDTAEAKTSLLYNLAAAHEKQFGISKDIQNLRTARVLLQSFAQRIPTIYGETKEAKSELDRVEHRIAEIDAQIEEAAGATAPPDVEDEPEEQPTEEEPQEEPADDAPADEPKDEPKDEPNDESKDEPRKQKRGIGKPLFYGGAAAIGLGLGAGGGAIAFMILSDQQNNFDDIPEDDIKARIDQLDKGLLYNDLAIGLGITSGVLVVGGIVLAMVGKKRMAKEESGTARLDGFAPYAGRGRAGVALTGRF